MKLSREKLKELLVDPGYIDGSSFAFAVESAEKEKISLERFLVERGMISEENLGRTIAESFNCYFVDLKKQKIDPEVLKLISEVVARSQEVIIFGKVNKKEGERSIIKVATSSIDNYEFFKFLERKTNSALEIYYTTAGQVQEALKYYTMEIGRQVGYLLEDLQRNPQNDDNIVKLVNAFLDYAYDNHASDIHIEPLERHIAVRFRIDGILHPAVEYPAELHQKIVFRIKIMSHLKTDEHSIPQDGRLNYQKGDSVFDVRVSVVPVTKGENIVMRILMKTAERLNLEDLGFLSEELKKVKKSLAKPHGMILSVGPTGSGKTSTLYSIIKVLNKPEVNVVTIEDPVEYEIEGVRHIQVNSQKNLTFSSGLRSIVRQDPNIIMVGEIRDNETAQLAVNAAMTGHLLLSTMHANDVATAFPRLIEMGVEPFLIASSVNVVIGQRLVRKICERCRASFSFTVEESTLLDPDILASLTHASKNKDLSKISFFRGEGHIKDNQVCPSCNGVGYQGRIGIFEVLEVTDELRALIIAKSSAETIERKARALGMTALFDNGIVKALEGITTLEEIIRVIKT